MNAPFLEPAHSDFGGSVAARVVHCPGSVPLAAKVPANLRKSSASAERGIACHAVTVDLIDENENFESLIGKTVGSYTITRDDVENALRPVYAHVEQLLDPPDAEFYRECRVVFPTIAGAFGTCDLLVRIGNTVHVVDFKFGSGVRVCALSPADDDPAADVINSQLLFYAAAARHSFPEFFAGVENIVLTILQPQSIEPNAEMVSTVQVTHAELDEFVALFRAACKEARAPEPRLERGPHCRFCPARPLCPLHTGPLLDLTQFTMPAPATSPSKDAYLQLLAAGLDLIDAVKNLRTALHDQAKRALENGDQVPGYALSAGRAERHWRDDEPAAIAALQSLGLSRDDIIAEALRSPRQIERRAKARGLKIPPEIIASRRSGVSLVRSENVRIPVRGRDEIARIFAAALETFRKEEVNYD